MDEVVKAPDIFEFDLKDCFPSINIYYGYSLFKHLGLPSDLNKKLFIINASRVRGDLLARENEFETIARRLINAGKPEELIERGIPSQSYGYVRGFAQGAPTSAFLSALVMVKPLMKRGIEIILGADDGLYYGNLIEPRSPTSTSPIIDGCPNTLD
jgi:hypothetical protein